VTVPFSGVRVVETGAGIAASYAGKLFADAGADVVKLEPAGGDPLRRWTASGTQLLKGEDSALFGFLNTSKRSMLADDPRSAQLLENSDVILVGDSNAGQLRRRFPGAIVVAVSPYGLISGSYAAVAAAAALRDRQPGGRLVDVGDVEVVGTTTKPSAPGSAARRAMVANPAGFGQPAVPYRIGDFTGVPMTPAPRPGEHVVTWHRRPVPVLQPLAGIRLLDLTANLAGPSATLLLAALGADVLKVEGLRRPDELRLREQFETTNGNKRGLAIDLDRPAGRELVQLLAARCDAVIEDFPQRILGLSPGALRAANPRTVLVRLSTVGLNGPADPICGLHAAFAILVALARRDRTGRADLVEVSLLAATLNAAAGAIVERTAYGDGFDVGLAGGPVGLSLPAQEVPAPALGEHNREVLTEVLGLSEGRLRELEDAGIIGRHPILV
jgi:crotonobetainyl-CoA:carnitine CoA-transferase CaiB-like acyl-CoA transferase